MKGQKNNMFFMQGGPGGAGAPPGIPGGYGSSVGDTFHFMVQAIVDKTASDTYAIFESRITELLEANNREVERRRHAETYLQSLLGSDFWKESKASAEANTDYNGPSGADVIDWLTVKLEEVETYLKEAASNMPKDNV